MTRDWSARRWTCQSTRSVLATSPFYHAPGSRRRGGERRCRRHGRWTRRRPGGHATLAAFIRPQLTGTDGSQHVERFAFNVGLPRKATAQAGRPRLVAGRLDGVQFRFSSGRRDQLQPAAAGRLQSQREHAVSAGRDPDGRTVLAYACSYHPATKEAHADGSVFPPGRNDAPAPLTSWAAAILQRALAVSGCWSPPAWRSWRLAVWMVRRDSVELRPWIAWLLMVLRVAALVGLLVFYLHLEKRTERRVVHNSRVLRAGRYQFEHGLARRHGFGQFRPRPNRVEQVVSVLGDGKLLDKLRETHDVVVSRFDGEVGRDRLVSEIRNSPVAAESSAANAAPPAEPASAANSG